MPKKGFNSHPIVFDGANEMANFRALFSLLRKWPQLKRELVSAPGYIQHRLWYKAPLTVGLLSWWEDVESVRTWAHTSDAHVWLWKASENGKLTAGGWMAVYKHTYGGPYWGTGVSSLVKTFDKVLDSEGPWSTPRPFKDPADDK